MDNQSTSEGTRTFKVRSGGRWTVRQIPASAPPPRTRRPPSSPMAPISPESETMEDEVQITKGRSSGRIMRTKTTARRRGLRPIISQSTPTRTSLTSSVPISKGNFPTTEKTGAAMAYSPKTSSKGKGKRKVKPSPKIDGSKKKKVQFQESSSRPPTGPRIINGYFACSVSPVRDDELEIEADLESVASELTGTTSTWPKFRTNNNL